jgi:hypothetical protein
LSMAFACKPRLPRVPFAKAELQNEHGRSRYGDRFLLP